MRRFLLSLFGVLSLLVACGKAKPPVVTPAACTEPGLTVGARVYYRGAQGSGTRFPSANAYYLGNVLSLFGKDTAEVKWDEISELTVVSASYLYVESPCGAGKVGKRAVYFGTQGSGIDNFPDTKVDYLGKVVKAFAGSYYEVQWDHQTAHTVHHKSVLRIED